MRNTLLVLDIFLYMDKVEYQSRCRDWCPFGNTNTHSTMLFVCVSRLLICRSAIYGFYSVLPSSEGHATANISDHMRLSHPRQGLKAQRRSSNIPEKNVLKSDYEVKLSGKDR